MTVIVAVLLVAIIVFYFLGRRAQKQREEQQGLLDQNSQMVSMLIIDKKRLKIKDSGLPEAVIAQTPKYLRWTKMPIVKAKVGPKIMTLVADYEIFDDIPVKREVKATVSGIYITNVKGIRNTHTEVEEKKGFFARFRKNK
jgi:hypothetical protein